MDIRTASLMGRLGVVLWLKYSEHIRLRFVTTMHNSLFIDSFNWRDWPQLKQKLMVLNKTNWSTWQINNNNNGTSTCRLAEPIAFLRAAMTATCRVRNSARTARELPRVGGHVNGRSIKKCLGIPLGCTRHSKDRLNVNTSDRGGRPTGQLAHGAGRVLRAEHKSVLRIAASAVSSRVYNRASRMTVRNDYGDDAVAFTQTTRVVLNTKRPPKINT